MAPVHRSPEYRQRTKSVETAPATRQACVMRFPEAVPTPTAGALTPGAHRIEDLPAVVEQCLGPTSVRWTTVPLNYTEADARGFLEEMVPQQWASESEFLFAIETTHPDGVRRFS